MKKILVVFGTRPEALKMLPLILELEKTGRFDYKICVTAQHRELLDQVINYFNIEPDYDFNLMSPGQSLSHLTSEILLALPPVINEYQPDYIFVQGDTTTALAASLCAFHGSVKLCHIEAGLRTYKMDSPYPEEINRQAISRLASYHFAPTKIAVDNLLKENIDSDRICLSGNTSIDALQYCLSKLESHLPENVIPLKRMIDQDKHLILGTFHRRENQGKGLKNICQALIQISQKDDVQIIIPVHPNPKVKDIIINELEGTRNILLLPPLDYPSFVWLMKQSYIIITDSGGIQEEAPSLGKPVLVARDTTERVEGITAGTSILVGTVITSIVEACNSLLFDKNRYQSFITTDNPYGDGRAASKIIDFLES